MQQGASWSWEAAVAGPAGESSSSSRHSRHSRHGRGSPQPEARLQQPACRDSPTYLEIELVADELVHVPALHGAQGGTAGRARLRIPTLAKTVERHLLLHRHVCCSQELS